MVNKEKWYNYLAKIVMIIILIPAAPLLIIISLAVGERPLWIYEVVWKEKSIE